jgi:hypothetical protein
VTSAEDRAAVATVEQVVRQQLNTAVGGPRGVAETAIPTIGFTVCYVVSHELRPAMIVGIGIAAVLVLLRLAQRSSLKFVLNSLFGILLAAYFAGRSGRAQDAFLPGILYNGVYAVAMIFSILVRWPVLGFLVGTATGDPTGWRSEPALVRLCSRLTWLLVLPCALRFAVQLPLYKAGAVAALGTAKVAMGWPLQVGSLLAMGAVLTRGKTPVGGEPPAAKPDTL